MTGLLDYYLGPTGIPDRLRAVGRVLDYLNPINAVGSSMQASRRLFAPETSGWGRVQATGDMLSGMAGAVAPGAVASRAGLPAANALQEGLMGFAMNPAPRMVADDVGRFFVDESGAIRVWHGSPHDFDRFSMDKIGTGEGAQAYGHGLYFAENREVADNYRRELSGRWDNPYERSRLLRGKDHLIAAARMMFDEASTPDEIRDVLRSAYGVSDEVADAAIKSANPGRLYEVEIDANPEDFLDWDAPLSAQPQRVQEWFDSRGITPGFAGNQSGAELMMAETSLLGPDGVADAMRDASIPGVRYLDHGSRFNAIDGVGPETRTRNYVVFDDRLISILNKYGLPLGIVGAGNYMMAPQDNRQGGL